jgi:hypothetical protein
MPAIPQYPCGSSRCRYVPGHDAPCPSSEIKGGQGTTIRAGDDCCTMEKKCFVRPKCIGHEGARPRLIGGPPPQPLPSGVNSRPEVGQLWGFANQLISSDSTPWRDGANSSSVAFQGRGQNPLHRARGPLAERLQRKLQRQTARRIPQRRDLLFYEGVKRVDRTMAASLQHRPPSQRTRIQNIDTSAPQTIRPERGDLHYPIEDCSQVVAFATRPRF